MRARCLRIVLARVFAKMAAVERPSPPAPSPQGRGGCAQSLSGAEIPVVVGGEVREHGEGSDVLAEGFGIDLVERVVGGVVQIEIVGAVLADPDAACRCDRRA